eukprot:CAMPEP_0180650300 /NCGR_PEP_ID=MMETSP1037_2-20121125/52141_1 /TAXON_ID=632150 /ORGANISM="Azadinium spinosum, Strain 3D9" /LENGTH=52 /DNA_ID=CAMNT_0022675599 /DNA_START=114 /DNA_END=272 /DNA_ORIENTATION=+
MASHLINTPWRAEASRPQGYAESTLAWSDPLNITTQLHQPQGGDPSFLDSSL